MHTPLGRIVVFIVSGVILRPFCHPPLTMDRLSMGSILQMGARLRPPSLAFYSRRRFASPPGSPFFLFFLVRCESRTHVAGYHESCRPTPYPLGHVEKVCIPLSGLLWYLLSGIVWGYCGHSATVVCLLINAVSFVPHIL